MSPITFEVIEKEEGGFVAGCYDRLLFAEEDTLEALCASIESLVQVQISGPATLKNVRLLMHL